MKVGILDKVFQGYLKGDAVMPCSDEAESIAMCAGYFLATGKIGTAYMSADGFMNTLNFLTSWIIPESIPINLVISIGRMEKPHYVATETVESFINILKLYDTARISYEFVRKS